MESADEHDTHKNDATADATTDTAKYLNGLNIVWMPAGCQELGNTYSLITPFLMSTRYTGEPSFDIPFSHKTIGASVDVGNLEREDAIGMQPETDARKRRTLVGADSLVPAQLIFVNTICQ